MKLNIDARDLEGDHQYKMCEFYSDTASYETFDTLPLLKDNIHIETKMSRTHVAGHLLEIMTKIKWNIVRSSNFLLLEIWLWETCLN